MPTAGLSLVGFLDPPQALPYFRNTCVPADPSDAALLAEWNAARANLGPATANAGHPDVQPFPAQHAGHLQPFAAHPAFQPGSVLHGAAFHLVEIDPLLAFQLHVDSTRSAHHCRNLTNPPPIDELLTVCLPQAPPVESIQTIPGPNSVLLKARSLNVQTFAGGMFNGEFMGIQFGVSLPFVHVVRHNGRCYLHNGFHRAVGCRLAGATHVACVLRDVPNHAAVGIKNGVTFPSTLLESADPPTLRHFTQGHAYDVALRAHSRVLHVSWAEYVVPDE